MKRYKMIGAPIGKVRTPPLLRGYLKRLGVEAEIEALEVTPDELDGYMRCARADAAIAGLLVTMPHKRSIVASLDAVSATARLVGSVNAVKRLASGAVVGAQFDGVALVNALIGAGIDLAAARVLLLGVGGAGMAIAHAIGTHGTAGLTLGDAREARVETAIQMLEARVGCAAAGWRAAGGETYDLLINATPVGMVDGDPSPFPPELVARATWVADIVSDPSQTALAALAAGAGVALVTGRDMVIGQIEPIGDWLLDAGIEQP